MEQKALCVFYVYERNQFERYTEAIKVTYWAYSGTNGPV